MLLGDGCLKPKTHICKDGSKSVIYEYVVCHSTKQQAYVEHKKDIFHSIVGGKIPNLSYGTIHLKNNPKEYYSVRFSRTHKDFRLLHRKLYCNNNKKFFTREVLDYLNPQALALWYMDDGTLSLAKKPDGRISSYQMIICTFFSEQEADTVIKYFDEVWHIGIRKRLDKKTQKYFMAFSTKEAVKFELLIHKYIIPSMMYKMPSKWFTRVPESLTIKENIVVQEIVSAIP